jgi:phage terminase large subunit-like protein
LRDELEGWWRLSENGKAQVLAALPETWRDRLDADFQTYAHAHQLAPERANSGAEWTNWLILGGRGAGKTRAGAEWVRSIALGDARSRIALIGETEHDAREVMVEGISGLLAVHRHGERPQWTSARRRPQWPNGAVAQVFSAENPEGLRGPQFSAAWLDELAAGLSPQGWAMKAIALWRRLEADSLVAEVNQGGDMVRAVIGEVDRGVPVREVRATRGKYLRAEPVAQLYEQGRVKHAGQFPALEDEMCDFGLDGLSGGRSPDRLDALVWAVTALTYGARAEPRVRGL